VPCNAGMSLNARSRILRDMAANEGMVGMVKYPLEQDMCGMRKEVVFEIHLAQSLARTLSRRRSALVVCIDSEEGGVKLVVEYCLGFFCNAGSRLCVLVVDEAQHAFAVVKLMMIQLVAQGLQDVS